MMTTGQHPRIPVSMLNPKAIEMTRVPAAANLARHIGDIIKEATNHLRTAQERQKHHADKRRMDEKFNVSDQVLLSTTNLPMNHLPSTTSHKLAPKFIGPFTIQA